MSSEKPTNQAQKKQLTSFFPHVHVKIVKTNVEMTTVARIAAIQSFSVPTVSELSSIASTIGGISTKHDYLQANNATKSQPTDRNDERITTDPEAKPSAPQSDLLHSESLISQRPIEIATGSIDKSDLGHPSLELKIGEIGH